MKKPPFNRFSEIFSSIFPISFFTFSHLSFETVSSGGKTVWGNPTDVGKIVVGQHLMPVVDWAKSAGAKQFLFISSARIYKATVEPPHVEGVGFMNSLSLFVLTDFNFAGCCKRRRWSCCSGEIPWGNGSWDSFRPQYMIWIWKQQRLVLFFACILRNRSVLISGSGMKLNNISHARDLSYMLIAAIDNHTAASGNIFNCVSDRAIVHYEPKAVGVDTKKAFHFRNMLFPKEFQCELAIHVCDTIKMKKV
ncbi:hypothetical protein MKX03_002560 [Papaver bracteatum]|nr:hypothetical protein MKX03_002560 [Papaver bracteatum]